MKSSYQICVCAWSWPNKWNQHDLSWKMKKVRHETETDTDNERTEMKKKNNKSTTWKWEVNETEKWEEKRSPHTCSFDTLRAKYSWFFYISFCFILSLRSSFIQNNWS